MLITWNVCTTLNALASFPLIVMCSNLLDYIVKRSSCSWMSQQQQNLLILFIRKNLLFLTIVGSVEVSITICFWTII